MKKSQSRVSNHKNYRTAAPYRRRQRQRDRISALPDSLILVILSFLEMRSIVRTTILSKRWKDLWTTVPRLDFCGEHPTFVDGFLAKWKGSKIQEFSIGFWPDRPPSNDLADSWLRVPIENQVEDVFLDLGPCIDPEYSPPQRLYSCSSITKLSIHFCDLIVEDNVNVQLNQLKSLKIDQPSFLCNNAMKRILAGAPVLEEFELWFWEISENIDIESTSLKMLKINMYLFDTDDFVGNESVVRISAPNLESLEIVGLWHTRCLLNVPSLINASLVYEPQCIYVFKRPLHYTLLEETFREAFVSISHVQKLTLNEWFVKFLVDEMKKDLYLLFPQLVTLIVEPDEYCSYELIDEYHSFAPNTVFPNHSMIQLKTVVITWDVRNDSIFQVIEILLGNAHALEKMVVRVREHEGCNCGMFIFYLQILLSMGRASPYAKVIISKD